MKRFELLLFPIAGVYGDWRGIFAVSLAQGKNRANMLMVCTAISDSPVQMRNIREDALAAFDVRCESLAKKKGAVSKPLTGCLLAL